MARKTTRSSRRTGQARPHPAAPPRRAPTHAAPDAIEQRLAELERERQALLAAAAHPDTIHADDETEAGDGTAAVEATEAAETGTPATSTTARPPATTTPRPQPAARRPAPAVQPAGARRVGRVTPATTSPRVAAQAARGLPARAADALDPVDPSIPFAQVPYVRADLRRVATIAAVMVGLIIIADIIVSNVVK